MITQYFKKIDKPDRLIKDLKDDSSTSTASTDSTHSTDSSVSNKSEASDESLETKISKGEIKLTKDQLLALQEIIDFITNPKRKSEKFYLLTGSAGTGKTFLVSFIYSILKANYNIAFTASTNKAVNVLQAMYEKQHKTDSTKETTAVQFYTIHRFMNSNRAIDKNGEAYFKFTEGKKGKKSDVVFVDEVSMIPDVLAQQLEVLKKYKKVILIGDRAQLPPVNEIESKLFEWKIKQSNLVEIVRYRNNIVKLADQLKGLIFQGKKINLRSCEGDGVFLYKEKTDWLNSYYTNTNNSVVLAYTNEQVRNYNDTIRKHELKITAGNRFEIGEKVMFNNFYKASHIIQEEQTMNYYTSYQVHIKSCQSENYVINYTKIIQTLRYDLQRTEKDPSLLDELVKKLPNNIAIYYLITEGDYFVNNPISYSTLQQSLEDLKNEFIKIKVLFSDLVVRDFWAFYYSELIDKFADVSYGYAMTVHKSQGSTYERVFIDMKDIIHKNPKERESFQCLYTAITRASGEIHVYY
jgi:DNA replication protein DnaC